MIKKAGVIFIIFLLLISGRMLTYTDATSEGSADPSGPIPSYLIQLAIDIGVITAVAGLWWYLKKKGQK